MYIFFKFGVFFSKSLLWKSFWSFLYVIFYSVVAGMTILMSLSDGLDPYIFRQKMKKTQSMTEGLDGELFISRQSRHFPL